MSVPHELGGVYPQLGGDICSRLDVLGNRERWRDFEQGRGKTQIVLKGTLVLAGNRQTSGSYVHSFLPSSFTPSPLCLSYSSHPQDAQSGGRQKGQQHTKKHRRVKERTSSWRTQGHFPEGAPFYGCFVLSEAFWLGEVEVEGVRQKKQSEQRYRCGKCWCEG